MHPQNSHKSAASYILKSFGYFIDFALPFGTLAKNWFFLHYVIIYGFLVKNLQSGTFLICMPKPTVTIMAVKS